MRAVSFLGKLGRCGFGLGADDIARGLGGQSDRVGGKLLMKQGVVFRTALCSVSVRQR